MINRGDSLIVFATLIIKMNKHLRERVDFFDSSCQKIFKDLYTMEDENEIDKNIEARLPSLEEEVVSLNIAEEMEMEERRLEQLKRRTRRSNSRLQNFEESYWHEMLSNPLIADPNSRAGKKFRRRFRLPFPLFNQLVEICEDLNVFETKYATNYFYGAIIEAETQVDSETLVS
jgi:hypothetical protein